MGTDAQWVDALVDGSVVESDDVLHALTGPHGEAFDERTDVFEAIAPRLLARGVPADSIVVSAEFGTEWGGNTARYERRAKYFAKLAGSMDPALAQLGRSGVARYEPAHREALAAEEHARVTRQE